MMDSMELNWDDLDALIVDFAKSENLIEDSPSSSPSTSPVSFPSSSSYQSRLLIRQLRRSLEAGDVDATMDLLRVHAPSLLDDHRLLFRLHKQKFVELLRKGSAEDRLSAINCLRTALAPCALDAYPEAYEEFKHVLLALIYDKDDQTSPVADEWSEKRRFDIAGLMCSMLRAHLHAYDPVFSMILRYLISIHKGFCFRQGIASPISDLTERLLFEERDPPAIPLESLCESPPFDEVDIQALAHAVEITRQGAVDSLRFTKGNLFQSFQNELCRMRLDFSFLDELVHEYCVYRGIVDIGITSSSGKENITVSSKVSQMDPASCLSSSDSFQLECGSKHSDGEISISNSQMEGSPVSDDSMMGMQGTDIEERYHCETKTVNEDCSTSRTHQLENKEVLRRIRNHGPMERNKRKRWKGRQDELAFISECLSGSSKLDPSISSPFLSRDTLKEQQVSERSLRVDIMINWDDKFDLVLGIKELASRGMAAEVVERINAMDPKFFAENPNLLFQLKQVEFLKLVSCGEQSGALKVASSHLGPLAANDPSLLKPLKETLLVLLSSNEEPCGECLPLSALATSLQAAIGRKLGIEEPQLMKIMRATLHTHTEWFKLQMCKDRFEGPLRIDSLKETKSRLLVGASSKSSVDSCTHESSQVTLSSSNSRMQEGGCSPAPVSSTDVTSDESAILKVMEFLALPRADAIHLLAQYNGNAETVIQQMFA